MTNTTISGDNYKFAVPSLSVGVDELLTAISTGFVLMMQIGFAFRLLH
jgi:hypothetical protein